MQKILACFTLMAVLSGCASAPTGPRVAVMPAPGKPFELFVEEEKTCRDYAEQSIGQSRNDAAAKNFVGAVVVGTAIGAAAGALGGGDHGNSAATGMLAGSMIGAGESSNASGDAQRRYDIAYEQCMYAKGNQIPGYAAPQQRYLPPPPPQ